MLRYILIGLIFCAIISLISTQMFCDRQQSHKLFEQIFNYEDMVYVFREDRFWIMKYNEDSDQWTQTAGPLRKSRLFIGMDDNTPFDNIFAIEKYDYNCMALLKENQTLKCRNDDIEFNIADIIFVFTGNKYLIYRRLDELRFEYNDDKYFYVPWKADTHSERNINQILPAINSSIRGAIVKQSATGKSPPSVAFLADEALFEYYILDKPTQDYIVRLNLVSDLAKYKDQTKNGGIRYKNNGLFFINGQIIQYTNSYLKDWGLNYWEFFCENMRVTTTVPKITGSDKKRSTKMFKEFGTFKTKTTETTTLGLIDKSPDAPEDYSSEDLLKNKTEDSIDSSAEGPVDDITTEGPVDDSSAEGPVDDITTEGPVDDSSAEGPVDDSSDEGPVDTSSKGSIDDAIDERSNYSTDGSNDLPIISSDVMSESSEVSKSEPITYPEDYITDDGAIPNIPSAIPSIDYYTPPYPPPDIDVSENRTDIPDVDIIDEGSSQIDDDYLRPFPEYVIPKGKYGEYSTKKPFKDEYKKLFLNLSYILFILTLITSLIVCSFAIYAFIAISAQL